MFTAAKDFDMAEQDIYFDATRKDTLTDMKMPSGGFLRQRVPAIVQSTCEIADLDSRLFAAQYHQHVLGLQNYHEEKERGRERERERERSRARPKHLAM